MALDLAARQAVQAKVRSASVAASAAPPAAGPGRAQEPPRLDRELEPLAGPPAPPKRSRSCWSDLHQQFGSLRCGGGVRETAPVAPIGV